MSEMTFDFSEALSQGIYFDHCIDLYFYKEDMTLMYILKTPETGYKPDITVKGTLIEGSYAISTSISVTNMHYDIDINAVGYIKCRMYYKGLRNKVVGDVADYQGHDILFSVLYADQDKDPPNRAIRFQCTVAANDYTRMNAGIHVDGSGNFTVVDKNSTENKDEESKEVSLTVNFKEYLKQLCELYNKSLNENFKKDGKTTADLTIKSYYIECEDWETKNIAINVKSGNISNFINGLNSITIPINKEEHNVWKVYIRKGELVASIIAPPSEELSKNGWPKKRESGGRYAVGNNKIEIVATGKSVILYYTKSAYRNETIINVTTTFDDRIYPGCLCSIMSNTIMGKAKARSSKISHFTDEIVTFRVTGKIDYEFSTTQNGYMTMQGPVVRDEDTDSFEQWRYGNGN